MKILLLLSGLAILACLHVCSGSEIYKAAISEKQEENSILGIQENTRLVRSAQNSKLNKNSKSGQKHKKSKKRSRKSGKKVKQSAKKAKKSAKKAKKSANKNKKSGNSSRTSAKKSKKSEKKHKKSVNRSSKSANKSKKSAKKLRNSRKKSRKSVTKSRKSGKKSKKSAKNSRKPAKKQRTSGKKSIKVKTVKGQGGTLQTQPVKANSRAVYKGTNCEYIDLCALDTKAQNGCKDGEKFVVKGARGSVKTRRQFLILDGKKIIAFLQIGKKITDCKGNMTDVTSKVSCKAIPGAGDMKIEKQNTTAPAPAPAPAAAPAPPTQCPGSCNKPDFTLTSNPVVKCPCPEGKTCFTTIKSNAFSHTVTCGKVKETRQCGGPLYGTKKGIFIDIEKYAQPLCGKEKTYLTLIKDLEWKCKDLDIKPCDICTGTTPPAYPPVPCPPTPTPPTPTPPTPTPPTPAPPTPTPPTPTSTTPTPPTPTPPTPTTSTNAPRRRRGLRLPAFVFN